MILRKSQHYILLFSILCVASSCEKFKGDQSVPAYLSIDSIYLRTDYSSQGTTSQNITDAWVYVDDELLGAFELPAKLPVLKSGKHTLKVWPGIKKNGIAATRVNYEFYVPVQQSVNFTPDSTTKAGVIKTNYQSTAVFNWMEDFDNIAISLDTTSRSTAFIQVTPSGSPLTFEGYHSGMVVMDSIREFFECETHEDYIIPQAPVYLEMNFNTSNSLTVGVITSGNTISYQTPVLTLHPTNGIWKKIYIDLTTMLNASPDVYTFKVYLGTFKDSGKNTSMLLIDNFKLVTR